MDGDHIDYLDDYDGDDDGGEQCDIGYYDDDDGEGD